MEKPQPDADTGKARPVRVSISLDPNDYADIKNIARSGRVSVAWVVRDAVARYLDSRTPLLSRNDIDGRS